MISARMTTPAAPSGSPPSGAPGPARGAAAYVLPLYAQTLFLSAFLLFAVQPMFTKMVLPLLGGSAAVWNTAVVFFQGTLLCGYFYAHLSTRLLGLRRQTILHALVLLSAFLVLPIGVAKGWEPPTAERQIPWLIGLLAVSIGLPFFAVSATAPLLQKWFAHTDHPAAGDPYFLYGGSNLGSMAALLSYPFLVEPALGLRAQGVAWTYGYAALVAAIVTCGVILIRRFRADEAASAAPEEAGLIAQVTWKLRGRWLLLSVVPSALLLGVTLHIGTDIAAVPFLWVLPLALYLLTFVLVFARRPLVSERWMLRLQIAFVVLVAPLYQAPSLIVLLVLHIGAMFFTAMVCHGQLARLRPVASHLTEFYLWMSVGGVVGGFLAGIVAPLVFDGVYEYPIALLLGLLLRPTSARPGRLTEAIARATGLAGRAVRALESGLDLALPVLLWFVLANDRWHGVVGKVLGWGVVGKVLGWLVARYGATGQVPMAGLEFWVFSLSVVPLLALLAARPVRSALGFLAVLLALEPDVLGKMESEDDLLLRERSFFGVYSVNAWSPPSIGRFHFLTNGTTNHGGQFLENPQMPITYYAIDGPVGQFFGVLRSSHTPVNRIGVVGLGVGTLACYAAPGQRMTYYEIDPLDERIARDPRYFTYLRDAGERVDVVIGDGRLSLAKEPDGEFDALVVDAFSGDAIPAHLLTREAFAMYFRKLREHGLLLVHISNAFLDLSPVVANLAADAGLSARYSALAEPTITPAAELSSWVVLARTSETLAAFETIQPPWPVLEPDPSVDLWTDDYTNVLQVLRWKELGSVTQ